METFIENNILPRVTQKASGVCSHCFIQRQLYICNGTIHEYGLCNIIAAQALTCLCLPVQLTSPKLIWTQFPQANHLIMIPALQYLTSWNTWTHMSVCLSTYESSTFCMPIKLRNILGPIAKHCQSHHYCQSLLVSMTTFLHQLIRVGGNHKMLNIIKSRLSIFLQMWMTQRNVLSLIASNYFAKWKASCSNHCQTGGWKHSHMQWSNWLQILIWFRSELAAQVDARWLYAPLAPSSQMCFMLYWFLQMPLTP